MLKLSDKDYKAASIKIILKAIKYSIETKNNLNKETEVTKKNQIEIIELKMQKLKEKTH